MYLYDFPGQHKKRKIQASEVFRIDLTLSSSSSQGCCNLCCQFKSSGVWFLTSYIIYHRLVVKSVREFLARTRSRHFSPFRLALSCTCRGWDILNRGSLLITRQLESICMHTKFTNEGSLVRKGKCALFSLSFSLYSFFSRTLSLITQETLPQRIHSMRNRKHWFQLILF